MRFVAHEAPTDTDFQCVPRGGPMLYGGDAFANAASDLRDGNLGVRDAHLARVGDVSTAEPPTR